MLIQQYFIKWSMYYVKWKESIEKVKRGIPASKKFTFWQKKQVKNTYQKEKGGGGRKINSM